MRAYGISAERSRDLSPDAAPEDILPEDWSVDIFGDAAQVVKLRDGVEWTSFHGVYEGQTRNINIVKTRLNADNRLGIYYEYGDGADNLYLTEKCEYLDALVGTNGPMACCHFVRVNGYVMRAANVQDPWVANAALTIDNGVPDIVPVADNYAALALPNTNVGTGGPLLVYEGEIQNYDSYASQDVDGFLTTTHPRTAFGISEDGQTVIQVTVDGRWSTPETAVGMSVSTLAKLMKDLGCYKALNFDGGGGTAMWVYGHGVNGIVNHPCESPMNWDNPTLRTTGNAIYIMCDNK